jgi:hypothetical protein
LYGKGIYVIIVGDHGYTVLPRESKTIDVCEDTIISHGRAVEGIIDLDEDSCWVVRDNVGMLKQNYTIARGYRYLGSRPRGAVHGGMTPQELAVPVLVASRQKVETPMDLAIVIEGPIRRRRRVNPISIEIANPNRFPVIVNEVKLHLVEILGHTPQKINASSKLSLDAIFDSSNIYEENVEVRGVISYILNGRDRANLVEMSIKTEGAAIVDKAFEDEFDV